MNWAGALRTVLVDGTVVSIRSPVGTAQIRDEQQRATICDLPRGCAVIDTKCVPHPTWIRDGKWRQTCDYLVFLTKEKTEYVVLVEMKKTLTDQGKREAEMQLVRSRPIVRYLIESVKVVRRMEIEPCVRYLLVAESPKSMISKQRVRNTPHESTAMYEGTHARIVVFVQKRVSMDAVISAGVGPQTNGCGGAAGASFSRAARRGVRRSRGRLGPPGRGSGSKGNSRSVAQR